MFYFLSVIALVITISAQDHKPILKWYRSASEPERESSSFHQAKFFFFYTSPAQSYVTHEEVCNYLHEYANQFGLYKYISYGCEVTQLTVRKGSDSTSMKGNSSSNSIHDAWPKITLQWKKSGTNEQYFEETFDAVCVCNGHYATPSSPTISGQEFFRGTTMHSIEYDNPADFTDLTVLCVGARASGSDLAREISASAKRVYLSDPDIPRHEYCTCPRVLGSVTLVPRTISVDSESTVYFEGGFKTSPGEVDVIIFCSGYDYRFPFINSSSNLELICIPGERRVSPLVEQLWHAASPSITFVGLQHSVVPFPFFEFQAQAVVAQLCKTAPIAFPLYKERLEMSYRDAISGGPVKPGRVQSTHFLGSHQWDYCRKMARMAGNINKETEDFIITNKVSSLANFCLFLLPLE